jgi:hypothetical protein
MRKKARKLLHDDGGRTSKKVLLVAAIVDPKFLIEQMEIEPDLFKVE